MFTKKWVARLVLLIVFVSTGAAMSGCRSSGKSGSSSCGDPDCPTKH